MHGGHVGLISRSGRHAGSMDYGGLQGERQVCPAIDCGLLSVGLNVEKCSVEYSSLIVLLSLQDQQIKILVRLLQTPSPTALADPELLHVLPSPAVHPTISACLLDSSQHGLLSLPLQNARRERQARHVSIAAMRFHSRTIRSLLRRTRRSLSGLVRPGIPTE